MNSKRTVLVAILCTTLSVTLFGCGSGGPTAGSGNASASADSEGGVSWWGIVLSNVQRTTGSALEVIHDGTGWALGKNTIQIEQVGELQEADGKRVAEFRISVSRSDESFAANIENIECDELGLPTEQSQEKMNEAVEKIKTMLDKLQSS